MDPRDASASKNCGDISQQSPAFCMYGGAEGDKGIEGVRGVSRGNEGKGGRRKRGRGGRR